jgi:hypothetical protein
MAQRNMTLTLDNVHARATIGGTMMNGWMQVTEQLPKDTARVLSILQEGDTEPWLAPRHQWMVKDGIVFAFFDNVQVEGYGLWEEHAKDVQIVDKAVKLLERIIELIQATNRSAGYADLALAADRIRNAGVPIVTEGKER